MKQPKYVPDDKYADIREHLRALYQECLNGSQPAVKVMGKIGKLLGVDAVSESAE